MKLKLLIALIFLSLLSWAQNPSLEWVKQFGGPNFDECTSIQLDADKNIYATGFFSVSADFAPNTNGGFITSEGGNDVFICKLDSNGSLVWVKQLSGKKSLLGLSLQVDQSGNIYVTGHFLGTVDFDPGPGIHNLTSSGGQEVFICKLDNSGDFKWAKQLGGNGPDRGNSISVGSNGDVLVTGYFRNSADFDPGNKKFVLNSKGKNDAYVVKLDSNGAFMWAKQFGGKGNDYGYSIQTDRSLNIYFTGYFSGTADFDPSSNGNLNLSAEGSSDIFVCKLDLNGNLVWVKQLGGKGIDRANCIEIDGDDNLFVTGYFSGSADFDPGAGTNNLNAHYGIDGFICKLSGSGAFIWAKQFGSSGLGLATGNTLEVDKNKNVYLSGGYHGSFSFDNSKKGYLFKSKGLFDAFSCKFDPTGKLIWAFPLSGSGVELINSVFVDDNDNIYNAGIFTKKVDFDPNGGISYLTSKGNVDIFIQKLSQQKAPVANFTTSTFNICLGGTVSFTDLSTNKPTNWNWSFEGGIPATSSVQNPTVSYNSPGIYSVTLTTSNAVGTDAIIKTGFINVNYCPTLQPGYCGITLTDLYSTLWSENVPGATEYMFRITDVSTGYTDSASHVYRWYRLSYFSGVQYGKTYLIEVKAKVNGIWSNYGIACNVSTPATIPSPKLYGGYCGITLSTLDGTVYSEAVSGATQYMFKITHGASGYIDSAISNYRWFRLSDLSGVRYGKTYNVEVKVKVGNLWSNYGATCTVSTPATIPAPKLESGYCGITLTSIDNTIWSENVAGATLYKFKISNNSLVYIDYLTNSNNFFSFNQLSWLQPNTTYVVEVQAYAGGQWGNYGLPCNVTTPGSLSIVQNEQTSSSGSLVQNNNNDGINNITEDKHTSNDNPSISVKFNASIYPNPSNTGDVFLSINSPIDGMATILLTDVMGRHIFAENIALTAGGNVVKQNYSSLGIQIGMYLVTITTNEGSYKTVERLVIK